VSPSGDMSYLLLDREHESRLAMERMWQEQTGSDPQMDPECVMNLGDSAHKDNGWITWSMSGSISTLRRNVGMLWLPFFKRWILARERLAALGYPTYGTLASIAGVDTVELPDKIASVKSLGGNAMNVACVGTVTLVVLSCFKLRVP
jgi:hypothetical protein